VALTLGRGANGVSHPAAFGEAMRSSAGHDDQAARTRATVS